MDARLEAVAQLQAALTQMEAAIAAKYSKPDGGIPAGDLDADVNAALDKAMTAVQSLADYYTKAQVDSMLAAFNSTQGVVAATRPEAGADTLGKIYYIGPDNNDEYERYITSYDGSAYSWISLGSTAIDMTIYANGYEETELQISSQTRLQISDSTYLIVTASSSPSSVLYSAPVSKGDVIRFTASDSGAHTLRYGFSNSAASGYTVFNYKGGTVDTVDDVLVSPLNGFFVVYHLSSYFSNMTIKKRIYTNLGAREKSTSTLFEGMAAMLGCSDYEKVLPAWKLGSFQYYNQNGDASSSTLARTGYNMTNGRKWIFFSQMVSTGTGSAGIRFFEGEGNGKFGFRTLIEAEEKGLRPVLLEVPAGADRFRATYFIDRLDEWYAYLFDDDRLANLIRTALDRKHIKVCLLGNSYTADAWRYVPKMLMQYGITMESFFYYRGQGSLYDLDTQWTDTSPTGESDYDHAQHSRITFYVNSENDPLWREWGSVLSAADIVGRRKWDIICLQQGGNRCKDIDSYSPSLQNIIDKIAAICNYPYSLWWFMAYNGATQNTTAGANAESLQTQETIVESYPFMDFIPVAAAVFSAQDNATLGALGASSYHRMYASDDVHLQEGLPCYVAACTVIQKLLSVFRPGKSVLQDQFRATAEAIANLGMSQTANGSSTGVTDANCYLAQKAAIIANKKPFTISQI